MADSVLNEVYKKWETKAVPQIKRRPPRSDGRQQQSERGTGPRRPRFFGKPRSAEPVTFEKRRRALPLTKLPQYHGLFQYKMAPTILPINRQRPYVGFCCSKCLPRSRAVMPTSYMQSLCICNLLLTPYVEEQMAVIPPSLRLLYFMFCQKSKFSYPDVSHDVMKCDRLSSTIQTISESSPYMEATSEEEDNANIEVLLKKYDSEAKQMLSNMKASVNQFMLKFSGWFMHKFLSFVMPTIQVHQGQLELLRLIKEDDYPIIYLPLHRSHLDSILISFVLHMKGFKIPIVAVGEKLAIPNLSSAMKQLGAFFIERKSSSDPERDTLYRAVLQSYLVESLKASYNIELSIEGSRSRTGKSLKTQTGLLSLIVDSVLEGEIEDVYIVPISTNYERLLEKEFIFEQLGKRKTSKSFLSLLSSAWKMLHSNSGSVRIDFCQPFSLREFMQANNLENRPPVVETPPSSPCSSHSGSSESFLDNNVKTPSQLEAVVKSLADHVLYSATNATSLMSTQLVSFLFLTKHRQGATLPQLTCTFNWLREELQKHRRDVGFTGESSNIIKHAISLLGKDLVQTEIIELEWTSSDMENNNIKVLFYKPAIKLPYVLELQYLANLVVPVFLLDSIVVNALYTAIDSEICHFQLCDSKFFVSRDVLLEKAKQLCNLMSFEFLCFLPCADVGSVLNDIIDELVAKECLSVSGVGKVSNAKFSKQSLLGFDSSDEEEGCNNPIQQFLKVDLSEETIDYLRFLRIILGPCIESYWLSACTLLKLVGEVMEVNDFLRQIQKTAEDRLHKGLLQFEESFGTETLKNSLKLFESWQVIEYYAEDNGMKFVFLTETFDCEQKVTSIISKIQEFRQ